MSDNFEAAAHGSEEDDDLSLLLDQIGWGKLAATRARLANSLETRKFLELGLSLLQDDLLRHTGPDFDHGDRSRLFESLSRERIVERASELFSPDLAGLLSDDKFRYRWERKGRYTEDLIAYLFRTAPQQRHLEQMAEAAEAMTEEISLRQLVQNLAAAEVASMLDNQTVSLQTIVQAALPSHPRVRQYIQAQYELLLPGWAAMYERACAAYGLKLRPGFTWDDVALLFNSVVEGALVRARIDGGEPALSNGQGVLAGAILLMLPSLLSGLPDDIGTLYAHRR